MNTLEVISTYLKAFCANVVENRSLYVAVIITMILSTSRSVQRKSRIDWVEAIICGALTIAASSILEYFKLPMQFSIFIGGVIGFKGSRWVETKLDEFIKNRRK